MTHFIPLTTPIAASKSINQTNLRNAYHTLIPKSYDPDGMASLTFFAGLMRSLRALTTY